MKRQIQRCGLLMALLLYTYPAFALRGSLVESASTTPPGKLTAEFGNVFEQVGTGARQDRQNLTLSQGIQGGQQFDLVTPWRVYDNVAADPSFGDMAILHKIGALGNFRDGRVLVGTFTTVTVPTSKDSRVGKDNYQFSNNLLLTQASEHSAFNINAGSVVQTSGPEMMRYGAGFEYAWEKIGVFTELLGFTDFQSGGAAELLTGRGGVEFLIGERFTLDAGGSIGITKDSPDWSAQAGATMMF